MDVFLIRHAEAVDETLAIKDPARPLSAEGRGQARALGDRLRWHDCEPTHLFASPLVRTVQTAELVAAALGTTIEVGIEPALAPGQSARAVVTALAALPPDAVVMLVGHEPGLCDIASLLVHEDIPALAKAEAVRISGEHLRWRFAWNAEAPTLP